MVRLGKGSSSRSAALVGRVDEICDRFESEWKAGLRPPIERFLGEVPEHGRPSLFRELLAVELEYRHAAGERPTSEEYGSRFPDDAVQVAAVFDEMRRAAAANGSARGKSAPAPAWTDPRVGSHVGKYRILGSLGKGAMGVVYEAEDTQLGRRVALKLLPEALAADLPSLQRFLHEAQAAGRLDHPNVTAVYDVDKRSGVHFIAMQLAPNGSTADLIRAGRPVPWREATRIAADACRGLAAAHSAGLIHRDIKPANILLAADGTAKLADFGLCKPADRPGNPLTAAGAVVGTPAYMSPEQCRSREPDARGDIYCLGAVYWALLTGDAPYSGTILELLEAHCRAPVPDLAVARPELPAACGRIIRRAMAKEPADRYQEAASMLADLEGLLNAASADRPIAGLAGRSFVGAPPAPAVAAPSVPGAVPSPASASAPPASGGRFERMPDGRMAFIVRFDCGHEIRVRDHLVGRRARCPHCGHVQVFDMLGGPREGDAKPADAPADRRDAYKAWLPAVAAAGIAVVSLIVALNSGRQADPVAYGKPGDAPGRSDTPKEKAPPPVTDPLPKPMLEHRIGDRTAAEWRIALAADDPMVRVRAARALGALGDKAESLVPELLAMFRTKDRRTQYAAGIALVRIGRPAVHLLYLAFEDKGLEPEARRPVAIVLALMGSPGLPLALNDPDPDIRTCAKFALDMIDPVRPIGVPTFREWLRDRTDENVRAAAACALGRIGPKAEAAIPELRAALNDEDELVRQFAIDALSRVWQPPTAASGTAGSPQTPPPAMPMPTMDPSSAPVAKKAPEDTQIGSRTLGEWQRRLRSEDPAERAAAAKELGGLGAKAELALPALIELLKAPEAHSYYAAGLALVRIGRPAARPLFLALKDKDTPKEARAAIAVSLALIGPVPAPGLVLAKDDESAEVNLAAKIGLMLTDPDHPEKGVAVFRTWLKDDEDAAKRAVGAFALGVVGPKAAPAAADLAGAVTRDPDDLVKTLAARALAKIGPGGAEAGVAALMAAARGKPTEVALEAVAALGTLGPAASAARPWLREMRDETSDKPLRAALDDALRRIERP